MKCVRNPFFAKLKCLKEKDELEWDDDCRVGTGEQLELEVGDSEVCASAEKDEEAKEKEKEEEGEEVQELRVAWPLDE